MRVYLIKIMSVSRRRGKVGQTSSPGKFSSETGTTEIGTTSVSPETGSMRRTVSAEASEDRFRNHLICRKSKKVGVFDKMKADFKKNV